MRWSRRSTYVLLDRTMRWSRRSTYVLLDRTIRWSRWRTDGSRGGRVGARGIRMTDAAGAYASRVAHPEPPEPTRAPRRRSTATSNFGAGRRESHDATAFYERFEAPTVSGDDAVVAPYDLAE